ncbi:MAG: hypothetical protein RBU29_03795 [bacterium]|jgi:hypothetical protein|nr:hypothetical protein [bacterium]
MRNIWTYGVIFLLACLSGAVPGWAQPIGAFDGLANIGTMEEDGFAEWRDDIQTYSIECTGQTIGQRGALEDSFQFVYKRMNGNFSIEGRPMVFEGGRAGLMIRQSLDPGAPHVSFLLRPQGEAWPTFRTLPNGPTSYSDGETGVLADPMLRLVRAGNSISLYTRNENQEWVLFQTEIVALSDSLYVGLAAANEASGQYLLYDFEDVRIQNFPFAVSRSIDELGVVVTLTAVASEVVNATVDEIQNHVAMMENVSVSQGELSGDEYDGYQWILTDFIGEATMAYSLHRRSPKRTIWQGQFTDGQVSGIIGGFLTDQPIEFAPREKIIVHPKIPTFIEYEWGTIENDTHAFGLQYDPRVRGDGVIVHTNRTTVGDLKAEGMQFKLDVKQAGTYYLFTSGRREADQSDSFYIGFDDIAATDEYGFALGGAKSYDVRWHETYQEGGRFWNRTGVKRGFELSAGEHTLYVAPREQDTKLDWLVLTLDPNLVPALIYPEERAAEVIRQIPEIIGDIPQSIPITVTLYVTDHRTIDVAETIPKGWVVSDLQVSNGTAVLDSYIKWRVETADTETLTYTVSPQPGGDKYGTWWVALWSDRSTGAGNFINGDRTVPTDFVFQLRSEPIQVGPETVIVQAEEPHTFEGNVAVRLQEYTRNVLYVEWPSPGVVNGQLSGSQIVFNLDVQQDGTYYVFLNARGESSTEDSLLMGFDVVSSDAKTYGVSLPNNRFDRLWIAVVTGANFWEVGEDPRPFELTKGAHQFIIHAREPRSKMDWIGFTMDPTLDLSTLVVPGGPTAVVDFMLY